MHIVHGTWIPHEPAEFVQDGSFCLWIETDVPFRRQSPAGDGTPHPRHLSHVGLSDFLIETLKIAGGWNESLDRRISMETFLLPTAEGTPLPSFELLPYIDREEEIPDPDQLARWQICCYRLPRVIAGLNEIHFVASHAAEDFQLGADFLFWWQFSQELRSVLVADRYIPSLRYHELPGKAKQSPTFELHAGWELLSDRYEDAVCRYATCMPPIAAAGADDPSPAGLYAPESLLRHFAECMLRHTVGSTSTTAKLDGQLAGTVLANCFRPNGPIPGSDRSLDQYRQWADWRAKLTAGQRDAGFLLGFRLEEAADEANEWELHFLVTSKRDPSLRVSLAEYWTLPAAQQRTLQRHLGESFERHLLLALGYAARIYPRIWEGLETDRPAGIGLTLEETYAFLKEHAWVLEDAGFTVIVPAWWTREGRRRARVRLKTSTSSNGSIAATSHFNLNSVIRYQYQLSIDGQPVSAEEWRQLVAAKSPLVRFRGQWMELNPDEIGALLEQWEKRQQQEPEMNLLDLIRIGADEGDELEWEYDSTLEEILAALREKGPREAVFDPPNFHGALREYQKRGLDWLRYLERLQLNPCLADDMGLGKTIQVIAQLVAERNETPDVAPTLLIAPTSVLGNWRREIERFAPHLRVLLHHGPARQRDAAAFVRNSDECDVVITSFSLARLDEKLVRARNWRRLVVDEAQNIKNPQSAQARSIAKVSARHRLALTGTPVENRLRDLWSIFNFLNPGYLGKEAQFRRAFEVPIVRDHDPDRSAALKRLVEPFILRRLKTDTRIIQDLPEKTEQRVYCNLTAEQASLYEAVVRDVEEQLEEAKGIQRRGLVLATLLKLKQVCNHPAQFLHDGSAFSGERSHKLQRLAEMVDEVLESGESLLVFTQFTEAGAGLEQYIRRTLHHPTHYLHGGTSLANREKMVADFQDPESGPSVFVLSVRAGGTGLTLTAANHVFHFDRWWNPAVEDQATDRAFRIGQRKNVFVHKFVALGTVEERIDAMIEEKKGLAASIVGSDESWLTELDNDGFKDLIALRRSAILE